MHASKIWTSNLTEYIPDTNDEPHIKIKKLNLLIGPNNSGKSRLLRTLFSQDIENLRISPNESLKAALDELGEIFEIVKNQPNCGLANLQDLIDIYKGVCASPSKIESSTSNLISAIHKAGDRNSNLLGGNLGSYHQFRGSVLLTPPTSQTLNKLSETANQSCRFNRYYFPILRGMRPLGEGGDLFRKRTFKDYFSDLNESNLNIITGHQLYDLLVQNLLGQPQGRVRIKEYEKLLGIHFFGGAEVTLIPEYGKDTVSVKIGSDDQFPIYNLGDGLQQIIIITSTAFLEETRSIFFIEEPEQCLHPGLLRKLAIFLLKNTDHQYFATTHSNHLLDLAETTDEVTVTKITKTTKEGTTIFKVRECTRDRELLKELGVYASSLYLANSTIWIEGITDRLYIKAFMKNYLHKIPDEVTKSKYEGYLENFHYAFIEYQGGTLGHWEFSEESTSEKLSASSICSTAFLIADGDISEKGDRCKILSAELSDRFHILPCKEIENLLPNAVLLETSKRIFSRKNKSTIENLKEADLDKIKNISVQSSRFGIGYHLDKCLGLKGKGKNERRVFADESGTIKEKVKFCREAIEVMSQIEWELSPPLKDLCGKLFAHIAILNQPH